MWPTASEGNVQPLELKLNFHATSSPWAKGSSTGSSSQTLPYGPSSPILNIGCGGEIHHRSRWRLDSYDGRCLGTGVHIAPSDPDDR